jgi:RNA polymerase sigma-70 factor (ECF subfamily)
MANLPHPPSGPTTRVDEFMGLYTQYQRRLYLYLLSLMHNVTDAEDLLQQTNYILWAKFDEFEPGSNFGAWACRIGYLEVLKFREGRQQTELLLSPHFLECIREKMPEFSDLLEARTDGLRHCRESLEEPDRALITRRYAPGMSVNTLAAELQRPARSISKSLVRIRRALLECIDRRMRQEEHQ